MEVDEETLEDHVTTSILDIQIGEAFQDATKLTFEFVIDKDHSAIQ